jgi:two-component system NarL family sensor kinase
MPKEGYEIVTGIVIVIIILLIAVSFIFLLVTYSNKRKKRFFQENQNLQLLFNQQLLQSQLEIQEQTFNTISKEIHDNVGQLLSLAKVQANILEQGDTINHSILTDLKESISKAMIDLRDIARSLNSDHIKESSLMEMTKHELDRIGRLGITKAFMFVEGKERALEEQKKLITFRIVQESLQNIIKHAKAEKIEVFFYYDTTQFKLEIKDNGIGFDQTLIDKNDGMGLQNMISRAALIGGQGSIISNIKEGTTITIIIPYA